MVDVTKPIYGDIWASSGEKLSPGTDKIATGWIQEMMPYQYENFLQNRTDVAISYLFQKGIPEWSSEQEYTANKSVVTYSGQLYLATATTTNVLPTVVASWRRLTITFGANGAIPVAFGGTGATNATDARTNLGIGSAATVNLPALDGMVVKLSDNSLVARSLTGATGYITVTNGDGVAGNPTINVGANIAKTDADAAWTTTSSIRLPSGSTAQRGTGAPGRIRFNLESGVYEGYDNVGWNPIGSVGALDVQNFQGDGVRTTFTLTSTPRAENNTQVYFNGVYQQKNTYSLVENDLVFDEPPASEISIEVVNVSSVPIGTTTAAQTSIVDSGSYYTSNNVEGALQQAGGTLSKAILSFPTFIEAQAAAATLPDGQVVDALDVQERYKVQGGALVFEDNLLSGQDLKSLNIIRATRRNITDRAFGAKPGSSFDSSAAIKLAINTCRADGGILEIPDVGEPFYIQSVDTTSIGRNGIVSNASGSCYIELMGEIRAGGDLISVAQSGSIIRFEEPNWSDGNLKTIQIVGAGSINGTGIPKIDTGNTSSSSLDLLGFVQVQRPMLEGVSLILPVTSPSAAEDFGHQYGDSLVFMQQYLQASAKGVYFEGAADIAIYASKNTTDSYEGEFLDVTGCRFYRCNNGIAQKRYIRKANITNNIFSESGNAIFSGLVSGESKTGDPNNGREFMVADNWFRKITGDCMWFQNNYGIHAHDNQMMDVRRKLFDGSVSSFATGNHGGGIRAQGVKNSHFHHNTLEFKDWTDPSTAGWKTATVALRDFPYSITVGGVTETGTIVSSGNTADHNKAVGADRAILCEATGSNVFDSNEDISTISQSSFSNSSVFATVNSNGRGIGAAPIVGSALRVAPKSSGASGAAISTYDPSTAAITPASSEIAGFVSSSRAAFSSYAGSDGSRTHQVFQNPNGTVGRIDTSGNATAYVTSSDERLKTAIENADEDAAVEILMEILVRQFDWRSNGHHEDFGFIAQELDRVYEKAVSKSAADMWGVDNSKLVPLIVLVLQKLCRIHEF